jgi:hypothetical protein
MPVLTPELDVMVVEGLMLRRGWGRPSLMYLFFFLWTLLLSEDLTHGLLNL